MSTYDMPTKEELHAFALDIIYIYRSTTFDTSKFGIISEHTMTIFRHRYRYLH